MFFFIYVKKKDVFVEISTTLAQLSDDAHERELANAIELTRVARDHADDVARSDLDPVREEGIIIITIFSLLFLFNLQCILSLAR